jgi:quercetin dioxygenase-like cupin family protein
MKYSIKISLLLALVLSAGCNTEKKADGNIEQNEPVFATGEILISNNFQGTVWLNMMGATDSAINARFGNVTFEPQARTNWHSHPGGQILFITEGQGYYQVKGQPARLLLKGDHVEIPPNVMHWHGAGPDTKFAHIAISLNSDKGGAEWSGPVTDEEYKISTSSD